MKKGYKKDFQSWKGIVTLKLLCCNIAAGRFDWKKYCTPQPYCGQEICVIPLHCSYGQIGYTVYFPYSDMPEVEYFKKEFLPAYYLTLDEHTKR